MRGREGAELRHASTARKQIQMDSRATNKKDRQAGGMERLLFCFLQVAAHKGGKKTKKQEHQQVPTKQQPQHLIIIGNIENIARFDIILQIYIF